MYIQNSNHRGKVMSSPLDFVCFIFILTLYYLLLSTAVINFSSQHAIAQTAHPKNFLTYESSTYGFRIQYPADWDKIEFSQGVEEANRKIIVNFISPSEGPSDTFREYLIIEMGSIGSLAQSSYQYAMSGYLGSIESLPNFKLLESSTLSVANTPAQKLVYTYSNPEVGVTKTMDVLVTKNEKLYLLSFNSDADKYDKFLPTVQKIISSFQL